MSTLNLSFRARGPDGRFLPRKSIELPTSYSTATSADSSPIDTPELSTRGLEPASTSDSEQLEIQRHLYSDDNEDQDSLSGVPDPDTVIPFPTTQPPSPPHQHVTVPFIPTIIPPPLRKKMAGTVPAWFYGRADENAQNFLREVERYIVLNELKTEATKVTIFSTLLSAGSIADTWWTKLDQSHKSKWDDVRKAFTARWPPIVKAEKTGLDYQREILALRLEEDQLGTQITVAGVPTWAHLHFHSQLQQLIAEAGTTATAGLVYQVRENLPAAVKDLTTPGLADWTKFLDEVKNMDANKLREKAEINKAKKDLEKAQSARIARLESMHKDTVETMRLQMQRASISTVRTAPPAAPNTNLPPSDNSPRRIRYFPRATPPAVSRQRAPLTPEEKDILRQRTTDLVHHPDTTAGRLAYDEQTRQWFATYGQNGRVTEETPFPLRPGSAMICSGECFKCGAHGHIAANCPTPEASQLPIQEKIWRSITARNLGGFNRAYATQIALMFEDEYAQQWELEQGKGQGSSV